MKATKKKTSKKGKESGKAKVKSNIIYADPPKVPKKPTNNKELALHIAAPVKKNAEQAGRLGPGWLSYMQVTVHELLIQGFTLVGPDGEKFECMKKK
jgi:hypothetical protein